MAERHTMSSWDRIRQGVADVENLMDQKQYNLSMVRGRQTLEHMINYLAQSVGLQSPDLSTAVDELYNLKVISAESRENYHSIRALGNRAAHEGNNSAADAAASYQMLSREVYAFADSYAKTARQVGQMIRNGAVAPARGASGAYAGQRNAGAQGGAYAGQRNAGAQGGAYAGQRSAGTQDGAYAGSNGAYTGGRAGGAQGTGGAYTGANGAYTGARAAGMQGNTGTVRLPGASQQTGARAGYTINTQPEIGLPRSAGRASGYGASSGAAGTAGRAGGATQRFSASEVRRQSGASGTRTGASSGSGRSTSGRTSSGRRSGRSSATIAGVSPELILKIMIPVIIVILLIAVIKFATSKASGGSAQTSAVETTESVPQTMQVVTAAAVPVETTQAQTEPTTEAAVYKYTTTDALKVRTAPGTDAGVIAVLEKGTEVVFIEQADDKWAKISYNGTEAYVSMDYLKKEQVQ